MYTKTITGIKPKHWWQYRHVWKLNALNVMYSYSYVHWWLLLKVGVCNAEQWLVWVAHHHQSLWWHLAIWLLLAVKWGVDEFIFLISTQLWSFGPYSFSKLPGCWISLAQVTTQFRVSAHWFTCTYNDQACQTLLKSNTNWALKLYRVTRFYWSTLTR